MSRSHTIRWHLAVFALLIILPVAVVGTVVSSLYVLREKALVHARAAATVRDAANVIDEELQKYIFSVQTLSFSDSIARGDLKAIYAQGKQTTGVLESVGFVVREVSGRTILTTTLPFGEVPEEPLPVELSIADRKAVESGEVVISDLFLSRVAKEPRISVLKKISLAGRPALLALALSARRISKILPTATSASDWLYGITGSDGRIIFRSWDTEKFLGKKPMREFSENTREDAGSFSAVTLEGVPVMNFYTRSKMAGWIVAAAIPTSVLNAPYHQALFALLAALTLSIAASIVISGLYARRLIKPVQALRTLSVSGQEMSPAVATGVEEVDSVAQSIRGQLSALHQHEHQQKILVMELNHRVNNTLAVIQAIAALTLRRSSSLQEFGEAFEGRLLALAKSHRLLSRTNWTSCDMGELITECRKGFANPEQLKWKGPPVRLTPNASIQMSMLFHELSVNAAKYGAFSSDNPGFISIEWKIEGRRLRIEWKEYVDSLDPVEPKEGFGSELLAALIEGNLGGKFMRHLESDGLRFIAILPLDAIAEGQ